MTSGYILIAAIFLLGGIVAVFGDRVGSKIGKARLRLFNLRPRQTAMIITWITGMLISAITLGILFGLSESLRRGIFQLDDILKEKKQTEAELAQAREEQQQVQQQLAQVKQQQSKAIVNLNATNRNFEESKRQVTKISGEAKKLQLELDNLLAERSEKQQQLNQLQEQSQELQTQLQQREQKITQQDQVLTEKESRLQDLEQQQQLLQTQVQERDRSIVQLDEAIAAAEVSLQLRTNRLEQLESQLAFISRNVAALEQSYLELREKKIAVVKGQVLSSAVVRIVDPNAAKSAIDSLLRQANTNAVKATQFSGAKSQQRIVKITRSQVEQLESEIQDGQDYVIRILSAGNYVQGEKEVKVFADLALNKQIFEAGEEIATVSIDSQNINRQEVQERLNWLLAVSRFRAQRAGTLGEIEIGDNQVEDIVDFVNKITQANEPVREIKAVVAENTYTAGPLKIDFIVMRNGKIVYST
ncbi:MAG: DUF3084 domain-containing protein [Cyanobacteria bacterium J06621_12]